MNNLRARSCPLALLLFTCLAPFLSSRAAELQTFSYTNLITPKASTESSNQPPNLTAPPLSGLVFSWPRTKISFQARLIIESEVAGYLVKEGDKDVKKSTSTNYIVRLDSGASNVMNITTEDDPALQFYLVPVGGFFTDVKDGKVDFIADSGQIKSVAIKYEDKIGKFITGTIKLAAEVVGIVAGTQVTKSTSEQTPFVDRTTIEGLAITLSDEIYLTDEIDKTGAVNRKIPGVPRGMDTLQKLLVDRLARLQLPAPASSNWTPITSLTLTVRAANPIRSLNSGQVMSATEETRRLQGRRVPYIPGMPYRTPAPGVATVTLSSSNQATVIARTPLRIPEAGTIGWFEFKSKGLVNRSPSLNLDALGGIASAGIAQTAGSDELSTILEQAKNSAESSLDGFRKKADADAKAASDAKATDATRQLKIKVAEFDLAGLDGDITALNASIVTVNDALAALPQGAPKEEREKLKTELQKLQTDLRSKERSRLSLQITLDYLKQGVELKN